MNTKRNKRLTILAVLFIATITFNQALIYFKSFETKKSNNLTEPEESTPLSSLPASYYEWWNNSWNFRIPIGIKAIGQQYNAPVELYVNFTDYFKDLNIQNPLLNISSIRVIEYITETIYYEVECQFDPYIRRYNNQSNAIGDLIWILNGSTDNGITRDFFIYFNNGTNPDIPEPNYDTIRIWHQGFEDYLPGDIGRPTDGQDIEPTFWEISNTVSARGSSSLHIWGNCWKFSSTGAITITPNTIVTAKMRFDDPSPIKREISGIGFDTQSSNIPASQNSYRIRGTQSWGYAGSNKYVNQYYAPNTFFWYTFNLDTETTLSSFSYIFYIADDDSPRDILDLYWDDISIWAKQVQTTPNNSLQFNMGSIQPISFSLKITCKDEDGLVVPNAHIYITNNIDPSMNQDHTTDINGVWTFTDIKNNGLYNITIRYTQNGLTTPKTETVYYYENYPIISLNNEITAFLRLITLNFNITDKDNDPIQYGYVLLKNATQTVGKTILSSSGTGTIRWKNNTAYSYEVYYDYDALPDNSHYRYSSLLIYNDLVGGLKDIAVSTEITKITFNVTDTTIEKVPFTHAKLRFYNRTDYDLEGQILANVSVDVNGIAKFVSFSNSYGTWGNYSVDIYFAGAEQDFTVNPPGPLIHEYNFTLTTKTEVNIEIPINKENYNSTVNIIALTNDVIWGDGITIHFNFTKQDPSDPDPIKVTPNELYLQILDQELSVYIDRIDILLSEISIGEFNYSLSTSGYNLVGDNIYYISIIGNYRSYVFNEIPPSKVIIEPVPTDIKYYDYNLNELTNKRLSEIYLEKVNITVDYYNSITSNSLPGAYISYSWDYGSGVLNNDPIHFGLYYFEFDTALAPSDAEYIIDIFATLQNYTSIVDSLIIDILTRPTTINGTAALLQKTPEIYIFESHYFYFEYKDMLLGTSIGDINIANYYWYKLDANGDPLTGPGNEGSGDLEVYGNMYRLDFNTETREVGRYTLFVTLQKENYEVRNAFLTLNIKRRPISVTFTATGLSGNQINVVQGSNINFQITLLDPLNGSQYLTGVNVSLNIDDFGVIPLTEVSNGIYECTLPTNNFDTFFTPKTLIGSITIEKMNYESQSIRITIIVGMTEIFPGFPMFYFLILLIGILAIVGSLVGYRTLQRARIPKFIKKIRAMKKEIKSKKVIPESLLYPSKEQYIVKNLGDKWEALGLSLGDILGVKRKKGKRIIEPNESKGGAV